MQEIKAILQNTYQNVSKNITGRHELIYTIIEIKNENRDLINFEQPLYVDIKNFIKEYVSDIQYKDYGYDTIDFNKIIDSIKMEQSINKRIQLTTFAIRLLKQSNYDELALKLEKYFIRLKLQLVKSQKSFNPIKWIKAILVLTSINLKYLCIFLLFTIAIAICLLQQSNMAILGIYQFEYESYSRIKLLNQFLNILACPIGLTDKFKITPLNEFAVLILIVLKSLYVLIITNYIYEHIKKNLIN